jgi:hypothetical protein
MTTAAGSAGTVAVQKRTQAANYAALAPKCGEPLHLHRPRLLRLRGRSGTHEKQWYQKMQRFYFHDNVKVCFR